MFFISYVIKETIMNKLFRNIMEMLPRDARIINIQLYGSVDHSIHDYLYIIR